MHKGGGGSLLTAFTMAEILLSLTIIGVVAAITLPSLTGNINERTWNTQRKALYARFSQAISLMPSMNGYGTLVEDESGSVTADNVAETFITAGLSKVLKINNICDSEHLQDCGMASKITTYNSVISFPLDWNTLNPKMKTAYYSQANIATPWSHSMINSKAAAFETANGESIAVFYNPYCQQEPSILNGYMVPPLVCANFIYDLNGNKGPNTIGKDIGFLTVLYSSDSSVVAPVFEHVGPNSVVFEEGTKYCRTLDNARMPNKEEAMSLFVNKLFYNGTLPNWLMTTSSPGQVNKIIHLDTNVAMLGVIIKDSATAKPICIKR